MSVLWLRTLWWRCISFFFRFNQFSESVTLSLSLLRVSLGCSVDGVGLNDETSGIVS